MTRFPDKQAKVQHEIDTFVGSSRLPSFSDRDSLPYFEALYQEVLRYTISFEWEVFPIFSPHLLATSKAPRSYRIGVG
jgi:hypothetical protein